MNDKASQPGDVNTTDKPKGSSPAGTPLPGDEKLDLDKTPGEGSLTGSTPAGLSAEELRKRAETPGQSNDTGTS
ncbi:hypothetical protein HHL28_07135 [Aerophototrophica crusticola]|uniref:Uncharacterized protein n=1 Tax=Aerophototrophica crusticola TaxID=1709002 RepID=A0A858R782_9PROT|nr:hypothetical protein HHL28_07135 [Rhodospirillaceae bacterium B3]